MFFSCPKSYQSGPQPLKTINKPSKQHQKTQKTNTKKPFYQPPTTHPTAFDSATPESTSIRPPLRSTRRSWATLSAGASEPDTLGIRGGWVVHYTLPPPPLLLLHHIICYILRQYDDEWNGYSLGPGFFSVFSMWVIMFDACPSVFSGSFWGSWLLFCFFWWEKNLEDPPARPKASQKHNSQNFPFFNDPPAAPPFRPAQKSASMVPLSKIKSKLSSGKVC